MVHTIKSTLDMEHQLRQAARKVVLLDFYANWCCHCNNMEPIFIDLERKYGERLKILKIDVDKLERIADNYKVVSLPTFVIYKNGQKIRGDITGADEFKLKSKLSKLF